MAQETLMENNSYLPSPLTQPKSYSRIGGIFCKGTFFILVLSELNLKINLTRSEERSQTNEQDIVVSFEGAQYQPN